LIEEGQAVNELFLILGNQSVEAKGMQYPAGTKPNTRYWV